MNSYISLRKRKHTRLGAAAVLALCVLLSGIMLFSRLAGFVREDQRLYIPLTRSGGITRVEELHSGEETAARPKPVRLPLLTAAPLLAASWFQAYDDNTVWEGRTDVEIFRVSYENGAGQLTVLSDRGDKVIAPGTQMDYPFALKNTGRENVRYEMTMEAYFSHDQWQIPVVARVLDHTGRYLCGTEGHFEDVLELNQVSDAGTLKPGYVMPYTLQWEWPFEGDDAYDTLLGNLAVAEDITLTIVIKTVASYTPAEGGGIPQTGDTSQILLYTLMMLCSAVGLLVLYQMDRRRREARNG